MSNIKIDIAKEPQKTTISFFLDVDLITKLDDLEKKVNKSKSEIVREILRKVFYNEKGG
jgi:predicted DNA-binding protein